MRAKATAAIKTAVRCINAAFFCLVSHVPFALSPASALPAMMHFYGVGFS
jgi:hypothetical protein